MRENTIIIILVGIIIIATGTVCALELVYLEPPKNDNVISLTLSLNGTTNETDDTSSAENQTNNDTNTDENQNDDSSSSSSNPQSSSSPELYPNEEPVPPSESSDWSW